MKAWYGALLRIPTLTSTLGFLVFTLTSGQGQDALPPFEKYLPIKLHLIRHVGFYGAATHSQFSNLPGDGFTIKLINDGDQSWASAGLELQEAVNIKAFDTLILRVKGLTGGEKLWVNFRDASWDDPSTPQANTQLLPVDGLPTNYRELHVNLADVKKNFSPDNLIHIGLEIGSETAGNPSGTGIVVTKLAFGKHAPAVAAKPPKSVEPTGVKSAPVNNRTSTTKGQVFSVITVFLIAGFSLLIVRTWRSTWMEKMSLSEISPIYEINTRTWGARLDYSGRPRQRKLSEVPDSELHDLRSYGFRAIWLMGVWQISREALEVSKRYAEDFMGSTYAIANYKLNPDLGRETDLKNFVKRAHKAGLKVILDFVPNHMGIGSPWITEHPEYFIHKKLTREESLFSNEELKRRYPAFFIVELPEKKTIFGRKKYRKLLVAHGRDPYFDPWTDTAQLNYASRKLRKQMIKLLSRLSRLCDGVRCDMAMLALRDYVKQQWHSKMPAKVFDRIMPHEFWSAAITKVKKKRPDFTFIAECYWSQEGYLQQLGFDFTYNKHLYDLLRHATASGDSGGIIEFMQKTGTGYLKKSLHFIENHDEERARVAFPDEKYRPASALIATLPGAVLLHQGQLEGKRERLPVQRIMPLTAELVDKAVFNFYRKIINTIQSPVFREGNMIFLPSGTNNVVTYLRRLRSEIVLVAINFCSLERRINLQFPARAMDIRPDRHYTLKNIFKHGQIKQGLQEDIVYDGTQLYTNGLGLTLAGWETMLLKIEIASEAQILKFQTETPQTVIQEQIPQLLSTMTT